MFKVYVDHKFQVTTDRIEFKLIFYKPPGLFDFPFKTGC